jgi:hypothetical protein
MKKRMVAGYLTYINEVNKNHRFKDFNDSLKSMSLLKNENIEFISIDNNSISNVKEILLKNDLFNKCFHYVNNHFDVALFYTTAWYAREISADYICFLYDDFIAYDDAFEDVIRFMDLNSEVSCTRIPIYDFNDQRSFDADVTPKSKNPDSVRHYNCVTNSKLNWEGPFQVGRHRFYKNNWHYTSRPSVWRTDFFTKVLESQGKTSKVLQGFEKWAFSAFQKENFVVGVLDKGMVKTTPVSRSARGLELPPSKEIDLEISVDSMFQEFNNLKTI